MRKEELIIENNIEIKYEKDKNFLKELDPITLNMTREEKQDIVFDFIRRRNRLVLECYDMIKLSTQGKLRLHTMSTEKKVSIQDPPMTDEEQEKVRYNAGLMIDELIHMNHEEQIRIFGKVKFMEMNDMPFDNYYREGQLRELSAVCKNELEKYDEEHGISRRADSRGVILLNSITTNNGVYNDFYGTRLKKEYLKFNESFLNSVMTFAEATERWELGESTLRSMVRDGRLKEGSDYRKSGKVWLITEDAMTKLYGEKGKR